MATYEKGDPNADEIVQIQTALGIDADGKFSPAMVTAVKAWQQANGLSTDGAVGPDMLLALGLDDLLILEKGDTGNLVSALQSRLGLTPDGEFENSTEAALKAYKKQNGLKGKPSADYALLEQLGLIGGNAQQPAFAQPPATQSAPTSGTVVQASPPTGAPARLSLQSWAYQLADIDPATIAALPVDLVVIDYSADGEDATAFKPADTQRMKQRPGGGQKKLVSYLSIGEAENYRYYWQDSWAAPQTTPAWLGAENPDWPGNFKVRFWDPAWQQVILGSPAAYLDRIIAAGFDGVYLDIIDAFEYWRDEVSERPSADADMIAFVSRIAAYARARRPDFLIVPQNGEALLADAGYRAVISAQGKEDIFYGSDSDGKANKKSAINECLANLALATQDGLPILAIEYLDDDKKRADAETKLAGANCCGTFGPRDLDHVDLNQFSK